MSLIGKVLKGTGYVAGSVTSFAAKTTGSLVSFAGQALGADEEFCNSAENLGEKAGMFLNSAGKSIGEVAAGQAILTGIDVVSVADSINQGIKTSDDVM